MGNEIVAENVCVDELSMNGVLAPMVRPLIVMFDAMLSVTTSFVPIVTVGWPRRFSLVAVIGSVEPVKV